MGMRKIDNVEEIPSGLEVALRRCSLLNAMECDALLQKIQQPLDDLRHYAQTRQLGNFDGWLEADGRSK